MKKQNRLIPDLLTGLRFGVSGGGEGVMRAVLTTFGIGLAVALLLLVASLPNMAAARSERISSNATPFVDQSVERSSGSFLLVGEWEDFRESSVAGYIVQADGPDALAPNGMAAFPKPGELFVSQALYELMNSPDYALLQPRLKFTVDDITGVIGQEGVNGPADFKYYLGSDELTEETAIRLNSFGEEATEGDGWPAILVALAIVACAVLLLPVVLFVAVAARFGGERRDRRLAALRLIGADSRMVHRIAAGESLLGAIGGLVVGAAMFLIGRPVVSSISISEFSFYASDIVPSPVLTLLIVAAVLCTAVGVTMLALRSVSIEPLGVVRNAEARPRRLWWRLIPVGLGLVALVSMVNGGFAAGSSEVLFAGGTIMFLLGVAAILPWLIEALVMRMRGGSVSWQLGVRRLQLSAGGTGRVINGVAVAVAGGIALQMLFTPAQRSFVTEVGTENSPEVSVMSALDPTSPAEHDAVLERLANVDGVEVIGDYGVVTIGPAGVSEGTYAEQSVVALIADCSVLVNAGQPVGDCVDGDVVSVTNPGVPMPVEAGAELEFQTRSGIEESMAVPWTAPDSVRTVEQSTTYNGSFWGFVLITPGAVEGMDLPVESYVIDLKHDERADVLEHIRNAAVGSWDVTIYPSDRSDDRFTSLRTAILAGVIGTMILIGLSLLVSTLEQLQDRRRLMSVLVAFGTRRRSLCLSVLWQTFIPVAIGLVMALGAGIGLGALLTRTVGESVTIAWGDIGMVVASGVVMVLVVTALSMPALWRMMRPSGLRTE
ncbi:FtsX-like permease family protein [Stackebrandtia soli]|uniref:FtsX-like permease family protein n=1 Tax=Stackebrandtia soli TaxID=1892856 RepID=UPI0039EB0078